MKKIAKGHYTKEYKGFTVKVYNMGKYWVAEVVDTDDYEMVDETSVEDEKKGYAIQRIEGKIDNYLASK